MNREIVERRVRCPYCGETLCLTLDLSAGGQSYIEDCQVCCQPMLVSFEVDACECTNLRAERAA